MCSVKWYTVIAVCAVVAYAAARPGHGNDIEDAHAISNEISSTQAGIAIAKVEEVADKTETLVSKIEAGDRESESQAKHDEGAKQDKAKTEKPEEAKTEKAEVVKSEEFNEHTTEKLSEVQAIVDKAVHERFPHAVLFGGTCGGTIISPSWILTAGHCTLFTGGRYVLAGTNNSMDMNAVERSVKRLVIHPLFSVGPYWLDADRYHIEQVAANWDFLLAELEEPLPLDNHTMAAVELDDQLSIPEGLEVGYAGYGAKHHGETMRHEMHAMELEVQPNNVCKAALEQYDANNMVCTKGRPPRFDSACNGDSGSGLVANGKVYGVASWVENDAHRCYNGALVVFSRVGAVRDWIRQVTRI